MVIPSPEQLSPEARELATESRRLVEAFTNTLATEVEKSESGIDSRAVISSVTVLLAKIAVETNASMAQVIAALITVYSAMQRAEEEEQEQAPLQ